MDSRTWLPDTPIGSVTTGRWSLRDPNHVDGLELVPELHVQSSVSVDGRHFSRCTCGYVAEWYRCAPCCAVEEAETERGIALLFAESRIKAARARGDRAEAELAHALATERR